GLNSPFSDIDKISIRCMPEGMVFKDFQPVMIIEGKYLDLAYMRQLF
ncbi:unnamed protein product, partial [marine sediment metagenome]